MTLPSVCITGTSLVNHCNRATINSVYNTAQSWVSWAQKFCGYRFECAVWRDPTFIPGWEPGGIPNEPRYFYGHNAGVSGQTVDQILARKYAIASIDADYHVVDMGTNDIQTKTVLEIHNARVAMTEYLISMGRKPILLTILSRALSSWPAGEARQKALEVNRLTQEVYGHDPRVVVYDWNQGWLDENSANGEPKTGASGDGIHFDGHGAYWVGKSMASLFTQLFPPAPSLYRGPDDAYDADFNEYGNVLLNPVLAGVAGDNTGTTGDVADGFEFEARNTPDAVGVASKEAGAQVLTITPIDTAGTSEFYYRTADADYAVPHAGLWMRAGVEIEVVSGADRISGLKMHFQVNGTSTVYSADGYQIGSNIAPENFGPVLYVTPFVKLNDDTTACRWRIEIVVSNAGTDPIVIKIRKPFARLERDPRNTYGICSPGSIAGVESAKVLSDGNIELTFNGVYSAGTGGTEGFYLKTKSGDVAMRPYTQIPATKVRFAPDRRIEKGEWVIGRYDQPGNGFKDQNGDDFLNTEFAVDNQSTVSERVTYRA